MKKLATLVIVAAIGIIPVTPTTPDDDFNKFMKESLSGFNDFISQANKDFIDFMRNPWKKYSSKKPEEKRIVPEPVKQPVYNPQADPEADKPHELSIEEIFDLTTKQGKQKPLTTVNGGKPIGFEQPEQNNKPTEIPEQTSVPASGTTDKPETAPNPDIKPAKPAIPSKPVIPSKPSVPAKPATPTKPVTSPKPDVASKPITTTTPTTPAVPKKPEAKPVSTTPATPLYRGGEGREKITYAGADYYLSAGLRNKISLRSLSENDIADAYESLFRTEYKPLIADLQNIYRNDLKNEWALFMIVKKLSERYAGKNESIVMRQFLLNQLGYKARVARVNNSRLTLFVAPDTNLYGCIYLDINGTRFYDVDADQPYSFYMCKKDAPSAKKKVGMSVKSSPRTGLVAKASSHSTAKASVTANIPTGLIEFYKDLPQCEYDVYVTAAVHPQVEQAILPPLRNAIAGKDEHTAAGILLDFCQNGFKYATDDQQFGYEKPFFVEELFYYPYCDCEDRSILFRYLVKNLLGLDVVLLDYPGHIATAVRFNSTTNGDYVNVDGQKYTVCDPTYIGAGIGMAMPQFRRTAAKILKY